VRTETNILVPVNTTAAMVSFTIASGSSNFTSFVATMSLYWNWADKTFLKNTRISIYLWVE
jgi:hypothetical protein